VKVGQLTEAERVIAKLIEWRNPSGFMTRAVIYEAMRRDEAISDLRQALSIEPYLTEAHEALRRIGATP
jgi:hypothetical protein